MERPIPLKGGERIAAEINGRWQFATIVGTTWRPGLTAGERLKVAASDGSRHTTRFESVIVAGEINDAAG